MDKTKTQNVLNTSIGVTEGDSYQLKIVSASVKAVTMVEGNETRNNDKVFLKCETTTRDWELQISEALVLTRSGQTKSQGLWVQLDKKNQLFPHSTLGYLLSYHNAKTVNDLIGRTVIGYRNEKGYVVLTTFDVDKPRSK